MKIEFNEFCQTSRVDFRDYQESTEFWSILVFSLQLKCKSTNEITFFNETFVKHHQRPSNEALAVSAHALEPLAPDWLLIEPW